MQSTVEKGWISHIIFKRDQTPQEAGTEDIASVPKKLAEDSGSIPREFSDR